MTGVTEEEPSTTTVPVGFAGGEGAGGAGGDAALIGDDLLALVALDEGDEVLRSVAQVALRGDVERAADGVGAVLDVVGRGLDAVDLHGLDGAVEGAEGDVADGGLVAGDGLHDDGGGAADLGGGDGLVDLVDLDAGQLDERAAGAGAFLTGDDGDGIAAAVAAAGGEAQRHGADDADGKNCFEDLFHNSKLLFDCFL